MSKNRAPGRSLEEWMSLVTQCRQSGLSDAAWCEQNGISSSSVIVKVVVSKSYIFGGYISFLWDC